MSGIAGAVGDSQLRAGVRAGEGVLAAVGPGEGGLTAQVVCRERDGYLVGMACAPTATGLSPAEFVNGEAGAAEIAQALIGIAALAITGLATALIAGGWLAGGRRSADAAPQPERPRRRRMAVTLAVAGVDYAWLGRQEEAEAHLRAAVQRDPPNAAAKAALESLFGQ